MNVMNCYLRYGCVLGAFLLAGGPIAWSGEPAFAPARVMKAMPIHERPPTVPAGELAKSMQAQELVLGVTLGGVSRAYPINMLHGPRREMINDQLGGQPILIAWSELSGSAAIFSRTVGKQQLTLRSSGMLWNRSLVMQDQQTGSLWSHQLGRAMDGRMKGQELPQVASTVTDWQSWHTAHPKTSVLNLRRTSTHFHTGSIRHLDRRVLSYRGKDAKLAWRFDYLQQHSTISTTAGETPLLVVFNSSSKSAQIFDRRVGKQTLTLTRIKGRLRDKETGTTWDPMTGKALSGKLVGQTLKALPGMTSSRSVWQSFHPDTPLFTPGS